MFLPDPKKIQIPGFRIEVVKKLLGVTPDFETGDDDLSSWAGNLLRWENECLEISRSLHRATIEETPEVHWRTLVANMMPGIEGALLEERYYNSWKQGVKGIRDNQDFSAVMGEFQQYFQALIFAATRRRFMSTVGGRIGWAPADAQEGDVICVLYGGGPLFVLRFNEGGCEARLIGEAYVHGLMDNDEAFNSPDRGLDEDFVLI